MSKGHLKISLLGASFNTRNMGVGALTAGAIKCIKHQYPDADIFLLDYAKKSETYNFRFYNKNILIQLVNLRFSKKLYLKNNIAFLITISLLLKLIPSKELRKKIISGNDWLRHINESDIIASIAGGDSFSDIYGIERFFYVSLPQILALLMGKKLVLLPQTLGPFNGKLARLTARYIMNKAEIVYSRDFTGMIEMRDFLGIRNSTGKLRFCYDVGFVVDPIKPEKLEIAGFEERDRTACAIGLNVSGLLYMGGYTQDNMFGLRVDYKELINEVIEFLIKKKNANIVLIPHVFGTSEHAESDSAICENIYNRFKEEYKGKIFLVKGYYDQSEIKHIIGMCDFFIGSRMHACIAALSQNIPSVAIAYSKKFQGVMESIDLSDIVADPRAMDKAEIIDIIGKTLERRAKIKTLLQTNMPKIQTEVLNLFNDIGTPAV
ncbi:MAG: polysaccharide pyruvyl transferase family protein [Deltaproteobacteria bacterium]|nr:polysaccharide pyruvyl transferase family protein [Deltaproteobacteria bacterium]